MNSYTYSFTWMDKNGVVIIRYLDAASKADAIRDFKETFGFEPKEPKVAITRLTGAEN